MKKVKIIIADVNVFIEDVEKILTEIAPCYVEKYQKHKIQKDKVQEALSGYLLKHCLGVTRDEQLSYNEYQKPYLASGKPFFNLSHSGDYVVLAVADCEVGVDVEKTRKCHEATVKKVFSEKQKTELAKVSEEARGEAFTKIWTECESVLKLQGIGFSNGWSNIPVEEHHISVLEWNDYFIACATAEEVIVETEKITHF